MKQNQLVNELLYIKGKNIRN